MARGVFDVVSLIDVLHHLRPECRRAVIDQAAHVAPGGSLLYKDIGEKPLWRDFANRLHDLIVSRQWVRYTPLASVIDWGTANGLTPRECRTIDTLWYRHEMVVLDRDAN